MATINLGRIKPIWQGAWTTGTAYVKDDIVRDGVDSYICVTAHTAGATFAGDSANWNLMAQGAELPTQSGQAGKALVTDGSTLSWGNGGSLVPLASYSVTSNVANVKLQDVFDGSYDRYYLRAENMVTVNNSSQMFLRFLTSGATEYNSADYRNTVAGAEAFTGNTGNNTQQRGWYNQQEFNLTPAGGNQSNNLGTGGCCYEINIFNPRAGFWIYASGGYVSTRDGLDSVHAGDFGGYCATSQQMGGLMIYGSGGFQRANFYLYGVANA